jgi:hypothetical protein
LASASAGAKTPSSPALPIRVSSAKVPVIQRAAAGIASIKPINTHPTRPRRKATT